MSGFSGPGEDACTLLGGRYAVAGILGEGGVAIVHRARDTLADRDVALKRLRVGDRPDKERAVELFQQEFHTLSQLAHPRVVSVYDYGLDEGAPYYTMELLDGGDLLDRVPCEWRTASALARDVCSALSLIHSRRMVFRDLSPKNVRCTSDGRAKLLDFGALSPMGPAKLFVGTPAISAPEAVHLQPLDARTDLYSLGATLYYALTGRRPYPASALSQLYEVWKTPPPPPSTFVPEIPAALDGLVMELLQLDAALRPASAAETLDRLSAIAGLEKGETTQVVSKAYLFTPTLVGRDTSLERLRRRMKAAIRGQGGGLLVQGPRGVGRTRFLDACVLEGKIAGAIVLRADATDSIAGDYGAARALAAQLVDSAPDLARVSAARWLATLRPFLPALRGSGEHRISAASTAPAGDLQPALREWLLTVAEKRPVFVVVDDVDRVDAPTAALVALLAREAPSRSLLVVTSLSNDETTVRTSALNLLVSESRAIALAPLSVARTERLLRSLFGDVPNVQLVAHRLHAVSGGLPRDVMQLAQHLVDRGLALYTSGAWSLPHELHAGDLPSDMAHARRARVDALSADARSLAQAFALGPEGRYTFGECTLLTEHGEAGRLMTTLDELIQAELVTLSASDYSLSGLGFREPLLAALEPAAGRALYLKLSEVCARRQTERFRAAQYLLEAGEELRGLEALLEFAEVSIKETALSMEAFAKLVQSLPEGWLSLYARGLELCKKYGRSAEEMLHINTRVTGIASQLAFDATEYYAPLFVQLSRDAGLDIYATLEESLPPAVRLKQSFALAAERAKAAGIGTVVPVDLAIQRLGRSVASGIGSVAATLSVELLELLPPLAPLVPIAAAFASWQTLVEGVAARVLGQSERARRIYEKQLERLAAPDSGGLEETYRMAQELGITQMLGMLEAAMGLAKSLERATSLESSPLHEVNAIRIRMLYALWQGDVAEADRYKSHAELVSIERVRRQTNEGAHLLRELLAHALADDLTRVKRTLDAIEPLSRRAAGWRVVLSWAHAEYQRIRGNPADALEHVKTALASMHPSGHPVWSEAAGTHLKILVAQDRCEEARGAGLRYLEEAARRGIGYEQNYIRMPLAIALARLGAKAEAEAEADAAVTSFLGLGTTGLNLGLAYETRARVALQLSERKDFDVAMLRCSEHYRVIAGGPLAARYERLLRDGRAADSDACGTPASRRESLIPVDTMTRIAERIGAATNADERAREMLELLLESSGTTQGFLFGLSGGELVLKARSGSTDPPSGLLESARKYLEEQSRSDEFTLLTEHVQSEVKSQWTVEGSHVYRPVILSHEDNDALAITGLALLRTELGSQFRHPATTAVNLSRLVAREDLVARVPR